MATGTGAPSDLPTGPVFVDTASCRCSLQSANAADAPQPAWRCVGSLTASLTAGTSGKWFLTQSQDQVPLNPSNPPYNWAGDPPQTQTPQINSQGSLTPLTSSNNHLSLQDSACTGKNDTSESKRYYGWLHGSGPNLCNISSQVVPTPLMQNASQWQEEGCLPGFYCPNNDINRLPMYCPPTPQCLGARLAKGFCSQSQGVYEPVICPQGSYCPPGGKSMLTCPTGSFCPYGSFEPIPCSIGASCPAGSYRNLTFFPLFLLILLDIILIGSHLGLKITKSAHRHSLGARFAENASGFGRKLRSLFRPRKPSADDFPSLPSIESGKPPSIRSFRRNHAGFMSVLYEPEDLDQQVVAPKADADMMQFVDAISKCMSGTRFGLSFDFEDLSFQTRDNKTILSEITGRIGSGTLWGVMGASGAGKTTFVNVLMGKASHTGGTTKINGKVGKISDYRRLIGYVPQDDILLPELTVYENILHSARIRLPKSWSDQEVREYVDTLIRCLQLAHVKDSIVGSPAKPVISGGQRKRVSIGMELAAAPMALFLDEPTSGLDATAAASIMSILKALTKVGITVVSIIHQPRQEIFESLDNLLLLGAGRMLYQGSTNEAQRYFESVGFEFPRYGNPADVIMDIIAGQGKQYSRYGEMRVDTLIRYWSLRGRTGSYSPSLGWSDEEGALRASIASRGARFHRQLWLCLRRAMLQQLRNKSSFYAELGVGAIAGFLIGLSQYNEGGQNFVGLFHTPFFMLSSAMDYESVLQNALLTALSIGLTASSPGVKVFSEERLVYFREVASGHSRPAYYLGKMLSTIPRMIVANLHFTVLALLLSTPRISFWYALAANLLYFYCIYGLASIVSMIVRREDGPLIATLCSLIVGVLSGVAPNLATVNTWHLEWLWHTSPGTWLAELYFTQNVMPWSHLFQTDLAAIGTGYTMGRASQDLLMLLALGSVYRVIAFLAMCLFYRQQQK